MTDEVTANTAPAVAGGDGGAPAGGQGGGPSASGGGAPPDPGSTTTLAAGAEPTAPPTAPQTWPDDWRTKLAGDDKAFLKTLERFTDPAALAKSYREATTKIASGALKATAPPENATPEQIAAWRKDAGLPEAPEGYIEGLKLPNGAVFGEADASVLKSFAETAHQANIPPAQFQALVARYAELQDQQMAQQREADAQFRQQALIDLSREWGGETRGNINAIKSLFEQAPDGMADQILTARLPDGRLLGDHPQALRWLSGLAREMNPMATILPAAAQGDALKSGEARIKEIESMMAGPQAQEQYWRKPEVQAEYVQLLDARDKMQARGR